MKDNDGKELLQRLKIYNKILNNMQAGSVGKSIGNNFNKLFQPTYPYYLKLKECEKTSMSRIEGSLYINSVQDEHMLLDFVDMEKSFSAIIG